MMHRRMEKVSGTERKSKEEVLCKVKVKRQQNTNVRISAMIQVVKALIGI